MKRLYVRALGIGCLVASVTAATCGAPRPVTLAGRGVSALQAHRAAPAAVPSGIALAPGDFVLQSKCTRVVIGGMQRGGEARGAVLEALARPMSADDGVVLLAPRLYLGQRTYPIEPTDMYLVDRGGRPAVRVEGTARVAGRLVEVTRELTLAGHGAWIAITTRLAVRDGRPLRALRIGSRIAWGGAPPFVPGVGPVADAAWHDASWVGRGGVDGSVAFGFARSPLRMRAAFEQHGEAAFVTHTEVTSARIDVPARGFVRLRSTLVVTRGGLARAVRRLGWARGHPFREVLVTLPYVPTGSEVTARLDDGRPVIESKPDPRGQMLLPLMGVLAGPAASHLSLTATAYGHAPSDPVSVGPDTRAAVVHIPRGGSIRVLVTDADGHPMPGRVRFVGVDGSEVPSLGPVWSAAGAQDTVITLHGEVKVPLPPGRYEVIVTRGPEWSMVDRTVEVTTAYQPTVQGRLVHEVDPGHWVACDLHVHAAPSYDSKVRIRDRIASFLAEGIHFAAATDHNTVTDYGPTVRAMGVSGFVSVPGVEITTWDPEFGHFNAFPYPYDPSRRRNGAPVYQYTSPTELFRAVREQAPGALIQVNHPRLEPDIGYFNLMDFDPITGTASDAYSDNYDLLEVWNGFDLARPQRVEQVFRDWLSVLVHGKRAVADGSSDSHQISVHLVGYPRTYVEVDHPHHLDAAQVISSLRAGKAFVTDGPFLEAWVGDRGIGQIATVQGSELPVHVRVRAPDWMSVSSIDVFVGDRLVRTVPIPGATDAPVAVGERAGQARAAGHGSEATPKVVRFDGVVQVPAPERDSFVIVRVRGDATLAHFLGREREQEHDIPPMAFTNPIWIDADGDGRVPWVKP